MLKINVMILMLAGLILFSGCCDKHIEYRCPDIKVLRTVPPIDINVTDGCICGQSRDNIINGVKMLRKSEAYYADEINRLKDLKLVQ